MTTSGARNVRAGSAHRQGGDRDGFDGDPQVRAMRAVWFTMRDEDPPERGLAALLAAARVTAETMRARPTPWQRLMAGLRRPPTLALATVMVLVGGAVLLGRRGVDGPAARSPDAAGVVTLEPAPPETQAPSRPDVVAGTAVPGELASQPGAADERPAAAEGSAKAERHAAGGRAGSNRSETHGRRRGECRRSPGAARHSGTGAGRADDRLGVERGRAARAAATPDARATKILR